MKKILLVLVLFCLAQAQAQEKFRLGVKLGVGSGTLTGSNSTKDTYSTFLIGMQSNYRLGDRLSLKTDVYYTRFGSENDEEFDFLYLSYLNVPVLAKIYVGSENKFNIQIGPEFGFLMSSEVNEVNVDELFNSFNLSGVLGVGYDFKNNFTLGVSYRPGLSNVSDLSTSKTRLIDVSLGYFF